MNHLKKENLPSVGMTAARASAWFLATRLASHFPHFHLGQDRFHLYTLCAVQCSQISPPGHKVQGSTLPGSLQPFFCGLCLRLLCCCCWWSPLFFNHGRKAGASIGFALLLPLFLLAWAHFLHSLTLTGLQLSSLVPKSIFLNLSECHRWAAGGLPSPPWPPPPAPSPSRGSPPSLDSPKL